MCSTMRCSARRSSPKASLNLTCATRTTASANCLYTIVPSGSSTSPRLTLRSSLRPRSSRSRCVSLGSSALTAGKSRHAGCAARANVATVTSAPATPALRIRRTNPGMERGTAFSGLAGMRPAAVAAATAARRYTARSSEEYRLSVKSSEVAGSSSRTCSASLIKSATSSRRWSVGSNGALPSGAMTGRSSRNWPLNTLPSSKT